MPTLRINFLEFPSGQQLSVLPSVTIPFFPDVGLGNVTAQARVTPNPDWRFGFWNINCSLSLGPAAVLPEPWNDFTASAWYFEESSLLHAPWAGVTAFSLNQNSVLTGVDPIASVTPASAQIGPNEVQTGGGPVTIEAVESIGGAGQFISWLPASLATGKALTVPKDGWANAIAFY